MARVSFEIQMNQTGLPQLINTLKDFPEPFQRKVVRRAARRGMNIVRDAARAKARAIDDPKSTEKIYKNIVTNESARRGRAIGGIVMRVGVRGGALAYPLMTHGRGPPFAPRRKPKATKKPPAPHPGGDTRYWRHQEFGWRHVGGRQILGRKFMLQALMENSQAVADKVAEEINAGLNQLFTQGPG